MVQEFIATLIIGVALFAAVRNLFLRRGRKKNTSGCEGCVSDCGSCALMKLKTEIEEQKKTAKENKE